MKTPHFALWKMTLSKFEKLTRKGVIEEEIKKQAICGSRPLESRDEADRMAANWQAKGEWKVWVVAQDFDAASDAKHVASVAENQTFSFAGNVK